LSLKEDARTLFSVLCRNYVTVPPLFALLALLACSRDREATSGRVLSLDGALPTQFAASTRLRLGDPQVQIQLKLNGELSQLPFVPEWQNITGGPSTLEAFRGLALDGGSVGDTPPIHAAFTGLDVKIIAVIERKSPVMQLGIAPRSSVRTLSDLRGKRIAYSPGQAQGALVARVLKRQGLTAQDVTLVELGSSEFKDALSNNQVDVAPISGPHLVRYLRDYGAEGARTMQHKERDTLSFFYVRTAVLADPDKAGALRAYVRARTRAQLWAANHQDTWLEKYYVADQHLSPEEGRSLVVPYDYPRDWRDAIALTQETIDLLAEASAQPRFAAEKLFDLRFQSVAADAAAEYQAEAALHLRPASQQP
jgi:sulfonate transport system substrate-binding protein